MRHAAHFVASEELPPFRLRGEDREAARRDRDLLDGHRHLRRARCLRLRRACAVAHDDDASLWSVGGAEVLFAQQLVENAANVGGERLGAHDHLRPHHIVAVNQVQAFRLEVVQRVDQWTSRVARLCGRGDQQERHAEPAANHRFTRTIRRSPFTCADAPEAVSADWRASSGESGTLPCRCALLTRPA